MADNHPVLLTAKEAAKHRGVAIGTIRHWHRRGWLKEKTQSPFRFDASDLDDAATKAEDSRRELIRKSLAKRYPPPEPGTVSMVGAAALANVNKGTIQGWWKKGLLKDISKDPLRFACSAVEEAASKLLPVRDGDVPIVEIAHRIRDESSQKVKYDRVWQYIIRRKLATYWRRGTTERTSTDGKKRRVRCPLKCVREEQVSSIVAYIEETSQQEADEFSLAQAAKLYGVGSENLKLALEEFAPNSGRKIAYREVSGSLLPKTVYSQTAIEFALRGEPWTPPAADDIQEKPPPNGESKEQTAQKSRKGVGGRKSKWNHVVKWFRQQKRASTGLTIRKALKQYHATFPDRPCPTYEQFKKANQYRR